MRYCPLCGESTSALQCPEDGTPTVRRVASATGHVLRGEVIGGRYRVNDVIGRGGFGTVYEAQHVTTGHAVAVKLLSQRPGAEGDELARRFFKEAATTSRLSHPNTVRVFDFGQTEGGDLFIAMERLVGESLQELISRNHQRREVMSEAQTVEVGVAVLRSLGEAHAHGLVHRDLKPANIFLHQVAGGDSIIKVLDFGIVKDVDTSITQAGKALGTPTHMSPEQAMGKQVDARCDLYALGCVLFECLTGTLPYFADNPLAIVMQHVTEPVPLIEDRAPGMVRPAVAAVVERALAKEPVDRWADASTMRAALQQALTGGGPSAFPLDMRPRSLKQGRSSAAPTASVARGSRQQPMAPRVTEPRSAPVARPPVSQPRAAAQPAASDEPPSIRVRLPQAPPIQTGVSIDDRTVVERPAMLDTPSGPIPVLSHGRPLLSRRHVAVAAPSSVSRSRRDEALPAPDVASAVPPAAPAPAPPPPVPRPFTAEASFSPPPPAPFAFSPPPMFGDRAAFAERQTVNLDALDAAEVEVLRGGPAAVALSSADAPLPSVSAPRLVTEEADGPAGILGDDDVVVDAHADVVRPPRPTGPTSQSRDLGGLGARGGRLGRGGLGGFGARSGMNRIAGGLAGVGPNPHDMQSRISGDLSRLRDDLRRRTQRRASGERAAVAAMWISPDGTTVLFGDRAGHVRMLRGQQITEQPQRVSDAADSVEVGQHDAMITCLAQRPGGRLVLTAAMDGTLRAWSPSGGTQLGSLTIDAVINALGVSVDGKLALAGCDDGTARLIDLPALTERRRLRGHPDSVTCVAIGGSRRAVITAGKGGTIRTWDPVGGGARLTARGHRGAVSAIALDRRGKWVLSGGWDGKARIWSPRTGDTLHVVNAHKDVVAGVALDPNGAFFATVGDDRAARIWDLASGDLVAERTDFETGAKYVRFRADGRCIFVGAWDGSVRRVSAVGPL